MSPTRVICCPSLQPYFLIRSSPTRRPLRSLLQASADPSAMADASKMSKKTTGSTAKRWKTWKAEKSTYRPPNQLKGIAAFTPGSCRIFSRWDAGRGFVNETLWRTAIRNIPRPCEGSASSIATNVPRRQITKNGSRIEHRDERPEEADHEEREQDRAERQ